MYSFKTLTRTNNFVPEMSFENTSIRICNDLNSLLIHLNGVKYIALTLFKCFMYKAIGLFTFNCKCTNINLNYVEKSFWMNKSNLSFSSTLFCCTNKGEIFDPSWPSSIYIHIENDHFAGCSSKVYKWPLCSSFSCRLEEKGSFRVKFVSHNSI